MGAVLKKEIFKMWIDEAIYNSIMRRIENLESSQFQANEMKWLNNILRTQRLCQTNFVN